MNSLQQSPDADTGIQESDLLSYPLLSGDGCGGLFYRREDLDDEDIPERKKRKGATVISIKVSKEMH